MNRPVTYFLLLFFFVSTFPLVHGQIQGRAVIAKAGDVFITEREFISRFEMLPGFGRHRRDQLESYKAEFLYTLVAEKLLYQEAVARRYDRDSLFLRSLNAIRKKLSRDELYRIEISQKVKLSDVEIIRGIARSQNTLRTAYLYFPKEDDAGFVRRQMKHPADFEALSIDSSISVLRDTASVLWGEADPALEDAVYNLKRGEISPVIKAGPGFYIVKIASIEPNTQSASVQPQSRRDRVVDALRLRKERARLDEYMDEVLKDKKGYSVPRTFIVFARALTDVFRHTNDVSAGLFSSHILDQVKLRCAQSLSDTLSVAGSTAWTLNDVVSMLISKNFVLEKKDSSAIPQILNTQLKILVQQELLEQEALRRGMDQIPSVKEKLEMWRQAMLASMMKASVTRNISTTEAETYAFMNSTDHTEEVPQVQIRQLITSTLDDMKKAMNAMQGGMTFDAAVRQWSIDTITRRNGGLTEFFPITERAPIGEIAWKMTEGQIYGPISLGDDYALIELIEKKSQLVANDTSFVSRFEKAKKRVVELKKQRRMDLFLAQTGEERGFAAYGDRLKNISVTPLPMMTYRVLGFGGKIIEVPFVDPQLDWLNTEPPASKILP